MYIFICSIRIRIFFNYEYVKKYRTEIDHTFDYISDLQFDCYLVVMYDSAKYDKGKEQVVTERCSNRLIDEYEKVEYG